MKGICFSCTAPRCLRSKIQIQQQETAVQQTERKPLFDLGQVVATPGALAALEKAGQNAMNFLSRHVAGDWGELCEDDRKENALSVKRGFRILSNYKTNSGECVWVITEADRSVTTLLLPDEY
jgi:hypothetical protein